MVQNGDFVQPYVMNVLSIYFVKPNANNNPSHFFVPFPRAPALFSASRQIPRFKEVLSEARFHMHTFPPTQRSSPLRVEVVVDGVVLGPKEVSSSSPPPPQRGFRLMSSECHGPTPSRFDRPTREALL